ncbi:hypothetical protein EYF80_064392 [Liparis tanakae]|uniref:Uncharacterized protein n=1 Tax=Liparis tanakae TaxID=230148 RepID=A0A4Z2E9E9_9TELE|nr:hypothetical protein EYF80_064392 [Liparis tanakae]
MDSADSSSSSFRGFSIKLPVRPASQDVLLHNMWESLRALGPVPVPVLKVPVPAVPSAVLVLPVFHYPVLRNSPWFRLQSPVFRHRLQSWWFRLQCLVYRRRVQFPMFQFRHRLQSPWFRLQVPMFRF